MWTPEIDASKGTLSKNIFELGITDLMDLVSFLTLLPYRRISDPGNLQLLLDERCGTCSTKHAFLKKVAVEQGWEKVELILCMYKMNANNTPGIGSGLKEKGLPYVPEAHCYVKVAGEPVDVTRPGAALDFISNDILEEISIEADQVGQWKKSYHRNFIQKWQIEEKLALSADEIWRAREACIASLSNG